MEAKFQRPWVRGDLWPGCPFLKLPTTHLSPTQPQTHTLKVCMFIVCYVITSCLTLINRITHVCSCALTFKLGKRMTENKGSHDSQALARSNWLQHPHNNQLRQSLVLPNSAGPQFTPNIIAVTPLCGKVALCPDALNPGPPWHLCAKHFLTSPN